MDLKSDDEAIKCIFLCEVSEIKNDKAESVATVNNSDLLLSFSFTQLLARK